MPLDDGFRFLNVTVKTTKQKEKLELETVRESL